MTSDVAPPLRRPSLRKRALGTTLVVAIALGVAWWIWSRPTRVLLTDGRTLAIDKVTIGPDHVLYAPFTFQRLWTTFSKRLKAWPNTTYHGAVGAVGVFYHSEPKPKDFADSLYVIDRDGWWWEDKQSGATHEPGHRLAVFPAIEYPSSPRFEAWNNGVLMGSGPLRFTPPVHATLERLPAPFPVRSEMGSTLIVLNSVDVTTRDDVRPNEAEGHLRLETFRHGQPVHVRLSDFRLTDALGRGCQCPLTEDGRFKTEISPHGRYWSVSFLVWRDVFDPLAPEAVFDLDPAPQGSEPANEAIAREETTAESKGPEGPQWHEREVDGVRWRFAIVPPGTTWAYRGMTSAFREPSSNGPEYKVEASAAPLLICEREPGRGAALRIEFRQPDDELLYHAIVDEQPDNAGRLKVGCPKIDPARPYRIRVGVHVPVRFHADVRPRVLGRTPPRPAVPPVSPRPIRLGEG